MAKKYTLKGVKIKFVYYRDANKERKITAKNFEKIVIKRFAVQFLKRANKIKNRGRKLINNERIEFCS